MTAALLAGAACSGDRPTQVVLAIATDLRVPDDIDEVGVTVERAGSDVLSLKFKVDQKSPATTLPATVGLLAGEDVDATMIIIVTGRRKGAAAVRRSASLAFVEDRILLLRMDLLGRCVGKSCPGGQTCTETGCKPMAVDPATLPDYS